MLDALASERHYLDHLAPVWRALEESERGIFFTSGSLVEYAVARGIKACAVDTRRVPGEGLVLVASYGDEVRCEPRPVVLLEHGAGQSYSNGHASYSGGRGRESVKLFLCPNRDVAERNRAVYPQAKIEVVGCPKIDRWAGVPVAERTDPPTVAISFHWQCVVSPEATSAWVYYRAALGELAGRHRLLGHGHPRIIAALEPSYRAAGIEVVHDFDEVLARANVYVIDNSSTGIEAMARGLPVVWMNSSAYRKDVHHGGRFWEFTEGIPTVDSPEELPDAIDLALADDPTRRNEIAREVFTFADGQSAKRAAEAVRAL